MLSNKDPLDDFIKVSFNDQTTTAANAEYDSWIGHSSHTRVDNDTFFTNKLLELYPDHTLVVSADWNLNLLQFPDAVTALIPGKTFLSHAVFVPFARRAGTAGTMAKDVFYGVFRLAWKEYEYTLYVVKWATGYGGYQTQHFILREGKDEGPIRELLFSAGAWTNELREEILVFQQGWRKDHALWLEIQTANWDDVILDDKFKAAIQGDIAGFFNSREVYKELAIPWKRGLILYGPPGNGKTISLKAAMKSSPHPTLYVRSFQWYAGDEAAMTIIFGKAREMSPCMLVIEDLDSHINDRNRSFFLNQLDGLDDNDGLLIVGTTNHFERLDDSISNRPSRFDRKYLFEAPSLAERHQYAVYWQNKLKNNPDVDFPDSLLDEIAELTNGFSFAYLKEVFVSTLMLKAGDPKLGSFSEVLRAQIKALKKQLEGGKGTVTREDVHVPHRPSDIVAQGFQGFGREPVRHGAPRRGLGHRGPDGPYISSTLYGGTSTFPSMRPPIPATPWGDAGRRRDWGITGTAATQGVVPSLTWGDDSVSTWGGAASAVRGEASPGASRQPASFARGQSYPNGTEPHLPGGWDCRPQGAGNWGWA